MKLNIIIPSYNEEGNIELLHEKITSVLKDIDYKLIFINDGSLDKTINKLKNVYIKDKKHVQIINFSRNFGKDAAIYAGLTHCNAQYNAIIDADLQQNPSILLQMMKFLDDNLEFDQVAMINNRKHNENFLMRFLKTSFYKLMNVISDIKFVNGASDFRMFRKNVVDAINSLKESNRFSKGIFEWTGFNTKYIPYSPEKRYSGKTNFSMSKSFKYAWEGIVNFSIKPLKIATFIGFIISLGAFIYIIYIIISTIITGADVPGYPSLISFILFLGGLQLFATGIVGEYIARVYLETKKRPVYIAKEKIGFDEDLL